MRSLPPEGPITIEYDYDAVDLGRYNPQHLGAQAIILTHDGRLLLQQRDDKMQAGEPLISHFGGGLEAGETLLQCLCRELEEELGARLDPNAPVWLGARIKPYPDGSWGLSGKYFWHDKDGIITGCYEGAPYYVMTAAEALALPNLHDAVAWCLEECLRRGLIAG